MTPQIQPLVMERRDFSNLTADTARAMARPKPKSLEDVLQWIGTVAPKSRFHQMSKLSDDVVSQLRARGFHVRDISVNDGTETQTVISW